MTKHLTLALFIALSSATYAADNKELTCSPLRACLVEAPAPIMSTILGDSERWIAELAGDRLVTLKPAECPLATNLVVITTKGTYTVDLIASCSPQRGTPSVRWSEPDAAPMVRIVSDAPAPATAVPDSAAATTAATSPVNLRYTWTRRRDPRVLRVYDDGARTFIHVRSKANEAPALYALGPNGPELLNYLASPEEHGGTKYVADRISDRFLLTFGIDAERRNVLITRDASEARQ